MPKRIEEIREKNKTVTNIMTGAEHLFFEGIDGLHSAQALI